MGYLSSVIGESKVTLKKLNPTRWAGRLTSLMGVKHRYCDVLKALTRIILEHRSAAEREEAFRLRNALQSFEFVLLVVVLTKVMSAVNAASIYLQSKDVYLLRLLTAAEKLKTAFEDLSSYREQFSDAVEEAKKVCSVWRVETVFKDKHVGKKKRHFDELCEDTRFDNPMSIASEFQFSTV